MELSLIIKFVVLMFVICGVIIFALRWALITSTEGAVNRLNEEIKKANEKQAELSEKLRKADEELALRQQEAKELSDKMRNDAAEETKQEREKIIGAARVEGEEIIAKAQGAKEKMRTELEKEVDSKMIDFGMNILNEILSDKAKKSLNSTLVEEFVSNLQNMDMSKISPDVKSLEIVSLTSIEDTTKNKVGEIIKTKIGRELPINASVDENIGGGLILKFGSMSLDGSIKNLIRERGTELKEKVESGISITKEKDY